MIKIQKAPGVLLRARSLPFRAAFVALLTAAAVPAAAQSIPGGSAAVSPDPVQWQPITIDVPGPYAAEDAAENPFRHFRMTVTFRHESSGRAITVPGFFAADADASESGAVSGNLWRAYLLPDEAGMWTYTVSLRKGADLALSVDAKAGEPAPGHGAAGSFEVRGADSGAPGFYGRGRLRYVRSRYLRFDDGTWYLKGGADSPENFLAYHEFDGTFSAKQPGTFQEGEAHTAPLHRYEPHVRDWKPGDPSWRNGMGKGILGALNYLAAEGMNSVYFLTMNVEGDGYDVWPWIAPASRDRYDVSKLAQWNLVFDHMDRLGLAMHVVLTETENESLFELEAGEGVSFADERKLYYRELVARFAHHPALVWNLGEENGWDDREKETTGPAGIANSDVQRRAFAEYLHALDAYDHPVVVHTLPGRYEEIYRPLVGFEHLDGASLQLGNMAGTHAETAKWVRLSREAGKPWVVNLDEIGPASDGAVPDADAMDGHHGVRYHALWGNLMAGGGGVEWYFGYEHAHNDLGAEDLRSRDLLWDHTRHALSFFQTFLPFAKMDPADDLTPNPKDYVFAREGSVYAVYLPYSVSTPIDLPDGTYTVDWYNPRDGGPLVQGSTSNITGGGPSSFGPAPSEVNEDWVVLIRRSE